MREREGAAGTFDGWLIVGSDSACWILAGRNGCLPYIKPVLSA
jgi:hypothetical protein